MYSKDTSTEIKVIKELRSRIASLLSDPTFSSAKWEEISQNVLPLYGIVPGKREQLLVFTEFVGTTIWLEQLFLNQGFTVRRYAGDISRDDREHIQADFQDKKFEVLISTDAGNEGIDLQSAHVLVNWDIPWSIVRLEQRVGRLHRIGQQSKVDIYNLISASTHEGRVQEVVLNNIVTAAEALHGQIFDFLGSVFEQLGIDYTGLLVRAGAGGQATEDAVARAQAVTAEQYKQTSEEQRHLENKLATLTNSNAFLSHNLQDRLDAVNPAIVTAFMRALSDARGWRMTPGLHEDLYVIQASKETNATTKTLSPALGGGTRAYIAVLVDALVQARREGADLAKAIVLGPAEPAYRELVYDIIRDSDDVLALGAVLDDPSALTPYELLVFNTALARRQNGRIVEWSNPLLIRADGSGVRVVAWQSIAHLRVPSFPQSHADFPPGYALQAEVVAVTEIEREAEHAANELRTWATNIAEQLDRLQDEVVEPYDNLPRIERMQRRAAVAHAIAERKHLLIESTEISKRPLRLIGRVFVRAIGGVQEGREDSNSEAISMRICMLHLEAEGFHVEDVHQEGRGYDLYARRDYEQRCVEVKGLKRDESPGIMLESSEWLMAQQLRDEYWVYVFTQCASAPELFGAYRNPVALFGDNKKLVQRFHIAASTLRRVLIL